MVIELPTTNSRSWLRKIRKTFVGLTHFMVTPTFPPMRIGTLCIALCLVCGCSSSLTPMRRTSDEAAMFGPVSMRVHPIFTQVKDFNGDGDTDGIEALVEFQDQFGDPTKASGRIIFELFEYRPYHPDPRGNRLVNPWIGSLTNLGEQRARWNRTSRTYLFQLEYPQVSSHRSYVLTATFDGGRGRFFDRIIIEAQPKEGSTNEPPNTTTVTPTSAPATQPAAP